MKKKYFIARIITLNAHAHKRIDEEYLFSSFEKAKAWVDKEKWDSSEKDENRYRFEIFELELDNTKYNKTNKIYEFNIHGEQIFPEEQDFKEEIYKFQLGDIVELVKYSKLNIWNWRLPVIGVVSQITEDFHTVDFISDLGYLDHDHLDPIGLRVYSDDLPDKLIFLENWSKHLSGISIIPEETVLKIMRGKVFLFNEESFFKKS